MSKHAALWIVATVVTVHSYAQPVNVIKEHNPLLKLGEHYLVTNDRDVTVLATISGETFEFEARLEQNGQDVGPGDIQIRTDPNVGAVTMTLVGHDGHTYGARDVLQIDLDEFAVTSTISQMKISEDLGTLGPVVADTISNIQFGTLQNTVSCTTLGVFQANFGMGNHTLDVAEDAVFIFVYSSNFGGEIHVGRDLIGGLIISFSTLAGSLIQIDANSADIRVDSIHWGTIHIGADLSGTVRLGQGQVLRDMPGRVYVGRDLLGSIVVERNLLQSGSLEIGQHVTGTIDIAEDLSGSVLVHGNCTNTIDIGIDLKGTLTIEGDLAGSVNVGREVRDGWGGTGHIAVDGSFASTAAITIQEGFASTTEFISCNNNGAAPGVWEAGATVTLWDSNPAKTQVFTADAPGERVRAATSVKGDMNNDGAVNGGDIDLFFFALGDPLAYAAAYPGLAGSLLYHGDCNCDGAFNGADITPFFDLLEGGVPCVGFNFWEPEYVAWLIETHVRPERLDRAIALIDDYTRGETRPDRRRFWNAVLDILAPS